MERARPAFSTVRAVLVAALGLALLAGCGEDDIILEGERREIRPQTAFTNQTRALRLPEAAVNSAWGHLNGSPSHRITHPALAADLAPLFSLPIGQGDTTEARITASPVLADGVIYTLDARARVQATRTDGSFLWAQDLTPRTALADAASGGGLAVAGGQLFVTTGFGEIIALDASTGERRWVQDLDAPATAPPTVRGGLVYLVARDSTAWALDVANGRIRWQQTGTPSAANFAAGAAPAVSGDVVVFPFPSGEVLATYAQGGLPRWRSVVSGDRVGRVASVISDISGDPVIVGNRVYIGNFGGRIVAFNRDSGARIWTAQDGAAGPVWPVGDALFVINDLAELVRLDSATGAPVWRVALPTLADGADPRRERRVIAHYGPVLAGGRLIVAGSDGVIRQFDPTGGEALATLVLPGGAASAPVVADETLYVVSKPGQLHAFR